jgi:hypothetical protein
MRRKGRIAYEYVPRGNQLVDVSQRFGFEDRIILEYTVVRSLVIGQDADLITESRCRITAI